MIWFVLATLLAMFITWLIYNYQIDYWDSLTVPSKIVCFLIPIIFWVLAIWTFFIFIF